MLLLNPLDLLLTLSTTNLILCSRTDLFITIVLFSLTLLLIHRDVD